MATCSACEKEVTKRQTENHHFPIPKRLSGAMTIPLCRTCHDYVDRISLEDWPPEWWYSAWSETSTPGRLLILKTLSRLTEKPVFLPELIPT